MKFAAAAFLALVALLPAYLVFRRVSALGRVSRRLTAGVAGLGAIAAAVSLLLEQSLLRLTQLSFDVRTAGTGAALLATFLLAAPLEEGLKTLSVWPLYRARRIDGPRLGLCYAAASAAGFAAVESGASVLEGPLGAVELLRALASIPAHLFFAGVWGYALGARRGRNAGWFSLAWLGAVLSHGLYDHIVWGRGPGFLVAVLPLLVFMALGAVSALRELAPESLPGRAMPFEPPKLSLVQEAFLHPEQPLMVRWVALGALVNVGLMLVLTVAAVLVGRRMGIDFSLADESDMRSTGPLLLLGAALLSAFPLGGYLVARGSSAPGLLEPALAALLALAFVVALLWLLAPLGVLFALAVAPLAFGLSCAGAWIGIEH